jgi:sulfide:quinone oxidoreductase
MGTLKVVICGAGIAGAEGLLRLRRLAGDRVDVTLLSPDTDLIYRPLAVREPFAPASIRRYPLEQIAADTGTTWIRDGLARVDARACAVHTEGDRELPYDALLLALGARQSAPFEHARVFTDRDGGQSFREIVHEVELGRIGSIAFVLPDGPVWPLPLYELALMTAELARRMSLATQITFITPEVMPLKAFGQAADEAILRLLAEAGIEQHTGVVARVPAPGQVEFGGTLLEAERIVTLPRVTGISLPGVPAGARWFVPIDQRCRVQETPGHVFAAGDLTDFIVKHGGVGAQQADTAAAGIAHIAGAAERPAPLQPVIRGMLLTGGRPLYLTARLSDDVGWRSQVFDQPPWPPDQKVIAEELGPYLAGLDASGLSVTRRRPRTRRPVATNHEPC